MQRSLREVAFVAILAMIAAFGGAAVYLHRHTARYAAQFGDIVHSVTFSSYVPSNVVHPIQSRNTQRLGAGKLLVASRNLADPNFAETVVLLIRYDEEGVVGLVLNRRTELPLSRVLESLKGAKDRSDPAYLGGPVETQSVFGLLRSAAKIEGANQVFSGVYLITEKPVFEKAIAARPARDAFHVYLGYAGWTREQLRMEVEMGSWFIFPSDAGTVFNADPDSLWPRMIRETELKVAESGPAEKFRGRAGIEGGRQQL